MTNTKQLNFNRMAPDLTLLNTSGELVQLSSLWAQRRHMQKRLDAESKSKVKALDEDYVRIRVLNEKEYADEYSMEEEDVIPERKVFEAMMGKNDVYHIESGT